MLQLDYMQIHLYAREAVIPSQVPAQFEFKHSSVNN